MQIHLKQILQKEKLAEILEFSNAAAAIVTTRKGAIRSMPENEEVFNMLKCQQCK